MSEPLMEQNYEQQGMQGHQPSAAELLRTTREGLGMSREEVAAELRLHVKLITALEQNERSQLPPAAFIGGYLRAYAKLLGLAPEPLINSYLDSGVSPSDFRSTDRSGEMMVSSSDPRYRMITVGVVVGLLVLFAIWWANERYAFVSALQVANQDSEQAEQLEPLPAEVVAGDGAMPQDGVEGVLPIPAPSQELGVVATTATAGGAAPSQQTAVTPAPVRATTPAVAPPVAAPIATPPAPANNSVAPVSASPLVPLSEPLPPTTPQARIRLEFQAECWTQITDAQGRTLAYQLMSPGRRLELRGVAPFKVFLGYAPGVLVYYNGSLFSHSSYQRGDVAKFSLGSAGDNRPLDR